MKLHTFAALIALASVTPALALNCTKLVSATEHAICGDPKVKQADADLTRLYAQVRGGLAPDARAELLRQQRDWITKRDARCGADPACLATAYQGRIAALTSLKANADANDGQLADVTPVTLTGEWHVEGIVDPSGHPLPADLARQLAAADLPAPGTTVRAAPGRLCLGAEPCAAVGWTATTLGDVQGGPRIAQDIRLPPSTRAYTGTDGSKWAYHFTLVRGDDDHLLALVNLCDGANDSACRNAYEVWRPMNPDSRILEGAE
jgi:uncharacterized protein